MPPTVTIEKPAIPTLWLDTSVVIKLTKIKRGEALQAVEVARGKKLLELIFRLVGNGELLCPESDQEEEYAGERLDKDVHGMFAQLSHGISLIHRQGILDEHIFKGMESCIKSSETIHLPCSSYFYEDPVRQLAEARKRPVIIAVGPLKSPEILERRAKAKEEIGLKWEEFCKDYVAKGQTFEQQLELEKHGHWDGLLENLRRFEASMLAGRLDFWAFMGAEGAFLYRRAWDNMRGQPQGFPGVETFFRSPYFSELPIPFVGCQLGAELLTGNEPIASRQAAVETLSGGRCCGPAAPQCGTTVASGIRAEVSTEAAAASAGEVRWAGG